jgi:FkbM family methyltransferase
MAEVLKKDYDELKVNRPKTLTFNGAICAEPGSITFSVSTLDGWSGEADTYPGHRIDRQKNTMEVPCLTLDAFLAKSGFKHVDYMTIDTEGSEAKLLSSWDPAKVVVDFIQIECLIGPEMKLKQKEALVALMETKGYRLAHVITVAENDTLDLVFQRMSEVDLPHFKELKASEIKV